MIVLTQGTPGSGCTYGVRFYEPVQSLQALQLERCRIQYEALLRRFGANHRLTKEAALMCKREAGYLISGAYCSGAPGWGNV